MVNWNPNFPEVLGNEWLMTRGLSSGRVWAGAPARVPRLISTSAETITALKLSATVDPLVRASVPTVIDVIEEGNEFTALPPRAHLAPNSTVTNEGWTDHTGGTTNIFQAIDEDTERWPGPAQATWIQTITPMTAYACSVNAALFGAGGAAQNGRVYWVSVGAILGANTGFRKLGIGLQIAGTIYPPSGGGIRDVHGYGSMFDFWWGEINPSTGRPWTPAEIADFGSAGSSRIFVRSQAAATPTHYPKVFALSLRVDYATTENRVAVGVWRRPEDIGTSPLVNVTTDTLRTMPAGTTTWAKATAKNYLFLWRQSVSPSEYGPVVADDVRWNEAVQDLGPAGQPANKVYPLHTSGVAPAPSNKLANDQITYDKWGRPQAAFQARYHGGYGLALVRSDAAISADSQPYRLDLTDRAYVVSTQKVGQRVTMPSAQSYIGVRLPIIPPSTGESTLTVAVHRVSDGVQMGGTFTITASAARALPAAQADVAGYRTGIRYVSGFLSSAASLSSGIAYEIRLTSTAPNTTPQQWVAFAPDASLGPAVSFGGTTDGAFIGSTHFTDRDVSVTLVKQPDPPTGVSAAITNVAVTTFSEQATTVPHIQVSWTQPAVGMGAAFARYEVERSVAGGVWQRIANVLTSSVVTYTDRTAPRNKASTYRIRAVGRDGRISAWATSGAVTPTETRPMLILSSNHRTDLYLVHLYEITDAADGETTYPILSTERDEYVAIHGSDNQVVFMEAEDRGVGWRTRISLRQAAVAAKGIARFDALLDLVRSLDIPYVCAMDHQGNYMLGHVSVAEGVQAQPDYQYTAALTIVPTHSDPVPAEVT